MVLLIGNGNLAWFIIATYGMHEWKMRGAVPRASLKREVFWCVCHSANYAMDGSQAICSADEERSASLNS